MANPAPTMRQLRSWHRKLTSAHAKAVAVSREAQTLLPDGGVELTAIMDPTIELHAALCCIEGFIEEREDHRRPTPTDAQSGEGDR